MVDGEEEMLVPLHGWELIREYGWEAWMEQGLLVGCLVWMGWIGWLEWRGRGRGKEGFFFRIWTRLGLLGFPGYLAWLLLDIWWI